MPLPSDLLDGNNSSDLRSAFLDGSSNFAYAPFQSDHSTRMSLGMMGDSDTLGALLASDSLMLQSPLKLSDAGGAAGAHMSRAKRGGGLDDDVESLSMALFVSPVKRRRRKR